MHVATKAVLFAGLGLSAAWVASTPKPSAGGRRVVPARLPSDLLGTALLEGRVQVDPEVNASYLSTVVTYDESLGSASIELTLAEDGSFSSEGLLRGLARIEVFAPDSQDPLARIEQVQVGGAPDPGLFELDVRGLLQVTEVELYGYDGLALERAQVAWRPAGEGAFRRFVIAEGAPASIVSRAEALDLYVQSFGHASQLEREVFGSTRVILREGLPLELELPSTVPALLGEASLVARLTRRAPEAELEGATHSILEFLPSMPMIQLDAQGRARAAVPASGAWRVEWRLYDGDDRIIRSSSKLAPSPIEVAPTRGLQTFEPAFSLDSLRAVLEARR